MELPKDYRIQNQRIPITPSPIPMRKTSILREIVKNNGGICNNYAQMGVLQFSGDELGQVPFRQFLEANDPTEGSFVSPNWVVDGRGTRLGQMNRVENVTNTRFKPNPNVVGHLDSLFSNREENFNAHFATNQVPLTFVEDVDTRYVPSNRMDTCYGYPLNANTRTGSSNQVEASRPFLEDVNMNYLSLGQSNADRRFVESNQEYVNGSIQSSLGPPPQYNSPMSFLPNLNSLPENIIPGTSASKMMTVPPTPLGIEKNQRIVNQNNKPLDIIDLESETSNNQIEQHFSNQVEACQIINSQQNEIYRNVVVNLSEEQGKNKNIDLNNTLQPKAKRKKHRPKVVREGKPIRASKTTTPKPTNANEATPGKRKYTRKKKDVDAQATPTNNVGENGDHCIQSSNKRVRRSLKFDDAQCQEAIENNVGETRIREAEKIVRGFDLNDSLNQVGSQNVTFPRHPFQHSLNSQHEAMVKRKNDFVRMMNGMTSSVDNGENINRLARMINDRGIKRDYNHVSNSQVHANGYILESNNRTSSSHESCNDLHKRRRTENAYDSWTSIQNGSNKESTFADIQRIMALQNMQSSKQMMSNQMESGVQATNTINRLTVSNNGTHVQASNLIKCHNFSSPSIINYGNQVRAPNTMNCKKVSTFTTTTPKAINCHKVSSTPTMNNEAPCQQPSTLEIATPIHNNINRNYEVYGPKARVEALVTNKVKLKTRTPRKKENPPVTSKPTDDKRMENIVNDSIDRVMPNLENVLVPYANGGGVMVPFENPRDFLKKKIPRPKVDLDPESNRVWKLLMGLEDGGKDVDKEKWWEEERSVFLGRTQSFIARMQLIQGNRKFSSWKGSVVDSVIGVFLTQNVADHLSSSAFMCLAARFPLKPKIDNKTTGLESARSPIIVSDEDCTDVELKKIASEELNNSKKIQESNLDFYEIELGLGQKSTDSVLATSVILSSPNSIDSSQNSSDCPNQAFNRSGLNPLSNFEARELLTGSPGNGYNSFTELLQMANDKVLLNPQGPFNNQVDWSSFHDNFLNSDFSGNVYTKQVNSSKKNESTAYVNQLKMNNMIKSEVQEEISKKSTVKNAPKGDKAPKVEGKKKKSSVTFDWDSLRRNVYKNHEKKVRSFGAMDILDYEALRQANVNDISSTIRERGMNNMLAERMQAFLNRLVEDHESIDLEWLRDVPPEKAKDYLLSIKGLGLKSVECVRLLTLHHPAFSVDTNVGRIAVRLGWVPLQPLPESLQLHLVEMYPMLETIQKYLWPRLCKIDQPTLYELHYHLITFGKVFCTKSKPNCNSCPMRGECKHFASAFASARLALPGPEEKRIVASSTHLPSDKMRTLIPWHCPLPQLESSMGSQLMGPQIQNVSRNCEPIIEEPKSPEPECFETLQKDIEDAFYEDPDEIPTIKLNFEEFTQNLQNYMKESKMAIQDGDLSKALVTIDSEAASIPVPKLKNVSRLRTEHLVYELPDTHPLLEGFDQREPDDPSKYLLAIWTPGETAQSIEALNACSNSPESGKMCGMSTCFSCSSIREAESQTVRGTILIPCRTANRGRFSLNGTYFQVNEVFADHDSSCNPIDVPRSCIWNLQRRTVFFGTSVSSIFRGLTTDAIQNCFRSGFICIRSFDRTLRSPKPLFARLHFTSSKATKTKGKDKKSK